MNVTIQKYIIPIVIFLSFLVFFLPQTVKADDAAWRIADGGAGTTVWDDAEETAGNIMDEAEKVWDDATDPKKHQRINDLPGNPNDVDKRNVWSATNEEIYNERREIEYKLKELEKIEQSENAKWYSDAQRLQAVRSNRWRLNERLKLLGNETAKRVMENKWDGFVPETPVHEPLDPKRGKIPDPNWGGDLPEINSKPPSTMGRSEIEPELTKLNTDLTEMRKKLEYMNSVGGMADKVGRKKQVEDTIKKIIARMNALQAEKNHQIQNGTWPSGSQDIITTDATQKQIDDAYREGYNLAKSFRNGNMSSAEVKQTTQDTYRRYNNNQKLRDAFKRGYGDGAQ